MSITLQAKLASEDRAQKLLFASGAPVGQSGTPGWEHMAAEVFPGGSFRSDLAVARRLAFLEGGPKRNASVQALLRHENAFAPLTLAQSNNLAAAGQDRAVFLITGQQPGLLGGPLLWLYKALSCAALAKDSALRLSRPVIPIFWVAGDDTDLTECNHIEVLGAAAKQFKGPFSLNFPEPHSPIPVGDREIDPAELAHLFSQLNLIWSLETVEKLKKCYTDHATLTSGFLQLAQSLLGNEGVLFVDGHSSRVRALARPIMEQAVLNWDLYHKSLVAGTQAAETAGIPTQVSLREGVVHAFILRDQKRLRLYAEAGNPDTDIISNVDLAKGILSEARQDHFYIADEPEYNLFAEFPDLELTHDVFTRPLITDYIFPVLGHVLGPAELKYFAQMSRLFLETTGDMPLLQPRMTAVVMPKHAWLDFQTEGLEFKDIVSMGASGLRAKFADQVWKQHPASAVFSTQPGEAWVSELSKAHGQFFQDTGSLERFQKTIAIGWKRYLHSLEKLAYQSIAPSKEKLFDHLNWLGGGKGQDRHLNFPSLLSLIGKKGIDSLLASLEPTKTEVQIFLHSPDLE